MLLYFHSSFCWFGLEVLSETSISEWLWATTQSSHMFSRTVCAEGFHAGWTRVKECTKRDIGWIMAKNIPLSTVCSCIDLVFQPRWTALLGNFMLLITTVLPGAGLVCLNPAKVLLLQGWPACDFWTPAACEQFLGQFRMRGCATGAGQGGCAARGVSREARPCARGGGELGRGSWGWYCQAALGDHSMSSAALFSREALNSPGDPGLWTVLGSHSPTQHFPAGPGSVKRTESCGPSHPCFTLCTSEL